MHPMFTLRQWGVLKQRQKTACETVYARLLAIEEVSLQTLKERARELDSVREAAKILATIGDLSPKALKTSAKVTLKLSHALRFVVRMELEKEQTTQGAPAAQRRSQRHEKA